MASIEAAVTKSLQCPICLELLTEPKILSCGHTFCTPCITLLYNSRGNDETLSCPTCRSTTLVRQGDLGQLQTNQQVKALVNDVAGARQLCTNCNTSDVEAVTFCQDCKMYMCVKCQEKHGEWKAMTTHQVSTVDDIKQGKVTIKKKTFCQEHEPEEGEHECTDVCLTCSSIICMKCRVFVHEKEDHDVQSAVKYTTRIKEQVKNLRERAMNKARDFEKLSAFIEKQEKQVADHIDNERAEIERIHQESVRKMNERKEILLKQCDIEKQQLLMKLENMNSNAKGTAASIQSASDLAGHSLKAPLEGDIVTIRHSLCSKLKDVIIGTNGPCYRDTALVTGRAAKFTFEQNKGENELELGRVMYTDEWKLKAEAKLSVEDSMNTTCATPDGRMAVGSYKGGIEIYNSDGQMQETVLKDVHIKGLGLLSDGRYVVIDGYNTMSLYTSRWEKLDVTFETLSNAEGGFSIVTVDSDDRIYVSYRKTKKIQVFTPAGGAAGREIPCDGFQPMHIFSLKTKKGLIVQSGHSVREIDADSGALKHEASKQGVYPYPAVRHDDSIIIAWVNHDEGFVIIDQYTSELDHVTTLITDHEINKSSRVNWYYLQEFLSGEIVLCTTDKLYIFH